MSTIDDYTVTTTTTTTTTHTEPGNDPSAAAPPRITKGGFGFPPTPSNVADTLKREEHPLIPSEKVAAVSLEQQNEVKAKMYERLRQIRIDTCPLFGEHCTKLDAKAILLGDDGGYTNSQISQYEQTAKQRLALSEYNTLTQNHLIESHSDYVKQRTKEYLETVPFRFNLTQALWDKFYNGEALKEHRNRDRDSFPKGPMAYDYEERRLSFALGDAEAKLKQLIKQKNDKDKPHLSKIYEETTEELFKELDR